MIRVNPHINISIIVATHDREHILWESVQKAVDSSRNSKTEIIVVNDGSKPLTVPESFSEKLTILDNHRKGVSSARNLGAANAAGEFLLFLDDDMWMTSDTLDWLHQNLHHTICTNSAYLINWEYPPELVWQLRKSKVGNYIISGQYHTMWGRMYQGAETPATAFHKITSIGSGSLLISKQLFCVIGGYNEAIRFQGEDVDFSRRANNLSIPMFAILSQTLYHNHADRLDLNGYLKRIERGYESQFLAEKQGILSADSAEFGRLRRLYLQAACLFKKWLILAYQLIPSAKMFLPVLNRILGTLAAITKYEQWKIVNNDIKISSS